MLCIVLFSGSLCEISLALTRKMFSLQIHLIPRKKLCPSCRVNIQETNEKEDSEENSDECNSDGDNDCINELEQTFVMLEQRSYINNTLEEMDISPVKLHAVPQHLRLVECKQELRKIQNILEEKDTKLEKCIADTFAINEDNLLDDKIYVCNGNAVIFKQKADNLDCLVSLKNKKIKKKKKGQSKHDEQINF